MSSSPIVAIALLTREDLQAIGGSLHRAYPISEVPCFDELLRQIDELYPNRSASESIGEKFTP